MKIRHILRRGEFEDILKSGGKRHGRLISLYTKLCGDGGELSVGVVIPARLAPKATKRNYVKRLVYAYFRENGDSFRQKAGIVVKLNKDIRDLRRKTLAGEIKSDLRLTTKEAGLLR